MCCGHISGTRFNAANYLKRTRSDDRVANSRTLTGISHNDAPSRPNKTQCGQTSHDTCGPIFEWTFLWTSKKRFYVPITVDIVMTGADPKEDGAVQLTPPNLAPNPWTQNFITITFRTILFYTSEISTNPFFLPVNVSKIAESVANSVDTHQTLHLQCLIWIYAICSGLPVRIRRNDFLS